jgi:hypothetical protein
MKCAVEIASEGMMHLLSFVKIVSEIQLILKLLPQQFEKLQC